MSMLRTVPLTLLLAACGGAPSSEAPAIAPPAKEPDVAAPVGRWVHIESGTSANLRAVWGSGPADVWAVGDSSVSGSGKCGTVLRWDGRSWRDVELPTRADRRECALRCVGGTGPDDVWVAGDQDQVLRWNGSAWSSVQGPKATYGRWTTCGTGPGGQLWLLGDYGSFSRWSGTAWINERVLGRDESPFEAGPYFRGTISGLWTNATGAAWVVGTGMAAGTIARWDGRAWEKSFTSQQVLRAVWGAAPDNAWAVGQSVALLHWDGRGWTGLSSLGSHNLALNAIWGSSASDVWVAGDHGAVWHWDGTQWAFTAAETDQNIHALWGASATEAWAVADRGVILRWLP